MQQILKYIFSGLGLAMGMAVLVIMIVSEQPDIKTMVLLLALGMASQGICLIDQISEKQEKDKEG
ncbi:MAG: hypothetical protein IJV22_10210 [Bacteroidales bacterium]|nr:hypothetical protein [Bacteroidales bacterium]MBQ9639911.1 hypothetical protein [Bacteroidales bacterium]